MSGVVHAVGKVFSGITHAVGHIVHEVATHWQEVALAAAAIYTGGLALGVWGGASAAAASAGSGVFTAASDGGALLANGSGLAGASGLAAASAGAGTAAELAGGSVASELTVGTGLASAALPAAPATALLASTASQGATTGSSSFLGAIFNGAKTAVGAIGGGLKDVASFMGGGNASLGMGMMIKTAFDAVGAYMTANPPPPRNFGGFGPNGGAGLGMHTTNGGFGLAAGGSTPAPSGVPQALVPPPGSATPPGAGLSNAANLTLTNNGQAPANIGQTVANNAGVGGLVPQGAVNFNQPTLAQPPPTFNPAGGVP